MVWLYYILLLMVALVGIILVALTLPGLWVMTAAAAVYAAVTRMSHIGMKTLIALIVLSLGAELLEIFLGGAAAKRAGGGKQAMAGAIIGGIVGGIFLSVIPIPIISQIVGICLGSFAGAAIAELLGGKGAGHAVRVGVGAAQGRFVGIVAKLGTGVVMFLLILVAGFP
jgi:uncharacterized protein